MAKFLLLRPKNLCVCLILLALATLVLIFQYQQNGTQGTIRSRPVAPIERLAVDKSAGSVEPVSLTNEAASIDDNGKRKKEQQNLILEAPLKREETPHRSSNGDRQQPATSFRSWLFQRNREGVGNGEKLNTCPVTLDKSSVDIDTTEVFATKLDFANVDSTYWSANWERRWNERRLDVNNTSPLKVFVLPHSHNDPGWLKTFDMYFQQQTSHILNNSVNFLDNHRDFRFVWSEMSFFARWWQTLDRHPHLRQKVIELVYGGQLEILTGGWVMTDEAGVHLYSMFDQLIEGHQWIKHHLGDKALPRNGWSIDPFGHGNAVPYLLRRSGIHNTFIQRTHYAWKRWLADRQQLEFIWQTSFTRSDSRSNRSKLKDQIVCHMAPFDLYSIKHTCGPDTSVCLRYDFRRMLGEHSESRSEPVSAANIHQLAVDLIEQYSKLGSLYTHNIALVLLGDDFRYDRRQEWEQQYNNYRQLFNYINENPKIFSSAHIEFGSLADYWNAVHRRQKTFPTLSGDFMPYGDIYTEGQANYWTGYFTTRPFAKQLARELQHYLRTAEIIYSLGRHHLLGTGGHEQLRSRIDADYMLLNNARQQMGIFQHHDAVTGTSKAHVMRDYRQRLFQGIEDTQSVIAHVMQYIQSKAKPVYQPYSGQDTYNDRYHQQGQMPFTTYLQLSEKRTSLDALPVRIPLNLNAHFWNADSSDYPAKARRPAKVVVFNSHAFVVQEAIRIHVTDSVQKVLGPEGHELEFQLNPVWGYSAELPTGLYELLFIAKLAPLSTTTFEVIGQTLGERSATPATSIKVFMSDSWESNSPPVAKPTLSNGHVFNFETSNDEDITMINENVHVVFSRSTGLLKSINGRDVSMAFGAYRSADFHSGAYLFRPDLKEPRQNVTGRFPVIRLVRGPLMSEVIVVYPNTVMQRYRVYHKKSSVGAALTAGIELETSFDLSVRREYFEMYMTLQSDLSSGQEFFTDSGGFETLRRLRNDLLSVEANYYPMTEAVFIQDEGSRLTLLADHAHGVTSTKPGRLEIMLDRKLRFDDARGLSEGVSDNLHTRSRFWLLMETRKQDQQPSVNKSASNKREVPLLSRTAHRLAIMLNFPPVVMQSRPNALPRDLHTEVSFLLEPADCDTYLLAMRTLPSEVNNGASYHLPSLDRTLLVLHNRAPDCSIRTSPDFRNCEMSMAGTAKRRRGLAFTNVTVLSIRKTSLTGTMDGEYILPEDIQVEPHELESFIVSFASSANKNNSSKNDRESIIDFETQTTGPLLSGYKQFKSAGVNTTLIGKRESK
ncbi:alpha-mannosidase 2x-like isoform X1 [Varroa jacobsoni]|uniref:alpha-mannosidase 2x-like isoform X1 n=1 Tax=Varroa jacobsoni TaxID=62625 RepID=UPI000BF52F85|nr:alpha-mannosidase 2x-like isoform X1 [Varroa jacobsoni]XP_022708910.1 alpha-mannosidase 2x-like isoform X1 [Varroa jacobsoni]XP_022708912.1 alpha-mannosidase 2x-like isoform X1 [Varroa jacobsoni]XP_022708913.1 alpha-mannosidase 2x-like isoform X1 [Varroa jacobsoni]XP_022708914.1 alpha-mannosidase 2x-like isoform X1 [Varroa jacobsoni]